MNRSTSDHRAQYTARTVLTPFILVLLAHEFLQERNTEAIIRLVDLEVFFR